jgi:adenine-specific DNA-methyltransferase
MSVLHIPAPAQDERPTVYADRVGQWYLSIVSEKRKKGWGQYLTPVEIADFLASLCTFTGSGCLRILDPGAGSGALSCALCEVLAGQEHGPQRVELEAYEIDPDLTDCLTACLRYAKTWLQEHGIALDFSVHNRDFIIAHGNALSKSLPLFSDEAARRFDIAISNPPYFKLAKSDLRSRIAASVVHGQPNIYALFMAVSAILLEPGGEFIFIVPRSFAAGPYFRLFRERFFADMRPEAIHLFGSRREAFGRDRVLQENLVLRARRCDGWAAEQGQGTVQLSFSAGAHDTSKSPKRQVALARVLDWQSREKVLRIPSNGHDETISDIVHAWPGNLHTYNLEISTGPVVPFRSAPLISKSGQVPQNHAPLFWMQHVKTMDITWPLPTARKPQYITIKPASLSLLLANKNYVLVRRFSAKEQQRRLTAAPFLAQRFGTLLVGIENHLNYIHRPGGTLTEEETYGLAVLLNSSLMDAYFRTSNGNTQVSATELRAMPLPPLEVIMEMGRRAMGCSSLVKAIDGLVETTLGIDLGTRDTVHE